MEAEPESHRGNRLLATLPADDQRRLAADLEQVDLGLRQTLYEEGEPIEHVFFPINGVISLVSQLRDGRRVEVATVGNEGMIGLPVFLQATLTSAHMAFSQIPGQSLRMAAQRFTEHLDSAGRLHRVLHHYTQALITQIAQNAACNMAHSVEQRAARWLLMTHDRVAGDGFELTQEFLAQMLGANRTTVTAVGQSLQDDGLITYSRGKVTVLDRNGLERRACECYGVINAEFARLLDPDNSR
jgi:CRP-like cAMP-binding protein